MKKPVSDTILESQVNALVQKAVSAELARRSKQLKATLAPGQQFFEYQNKPLPDATDLLLLSDESAPGHVTKNCTFDSIGLASGNYSGDYNLAPALISISGLSGNPSGINANYNVTPRLEGGFYVTCNTYFLATSNGVATLREIKIAPPIPAVFTNVISLWKVGFSIVENATLTSEGHVGDGWFIRAYANTGDNSGTLVFETSKLNTVYNVSFSFVYKTIDV